MALRFLDSVDHYTTVAQMTTKWTTQDGVSIGTFGRNGSNGIKTTGNQTFTKTLDTQNTWIIGAAINAATINTRIGCYLVDSATYQVGFRANTDGTLSIMRNGYAGTVLATSTLALSIGVWYFIEFKGTINNTTGSASVRVNGVEWVSVTGADTQQSANAYANVIEFDGTSNTQFDDIYVCDDTGATNNDFLGDQRNECIFADGVGNYAQWTPSSGSNFQNVDETTPNDDTDYNSSSTASQIDSFAFGDLTTTNGTVAGVQVSGWARKDDAGSRTIRFMVRIGGTNYFSDSSFSLSDTYNFYEHIWEVSPATSSAWTIAEINAAEFGYDLVS